MRIIMTQERSLMLESKPKIFEKKEKSLFTVPFLSNFREESIFSLTLQGFLHSSQIKQIFPLRIKEINYFLSPLSLIFV
jgi:hypothetical protein